MMSGSFARLIFRLITESAPQGAAGLTPDETRARGAIGRRKTGIA